MSDALIKDVIRTLEAEGFTPKDAARIAPAASTWLNRMTTPEVVGFAGNKLGFVDKDRLVVSAGGGVKESKGKPMLYLVPPQMEEGAARAFAFGLKKYAANNWRKGISHSELVSAIKRHINAWNEGEDNADDSGLSHLDHAAADLAMLMNMQTSHPELDDRYKPEVK